ncbi:MAG: hypothetical protein ABIR98_03060 [Usitatibacter sp.]
MKVFSLCSLCLPLCPLCFSFTPAEAIAAGCEQLNGTYEYQSVAPRNGLPEYLSNFVQGRDKGKLFVRESGGAPKGLSGGGIISRPKVTHLASAVAVTYAAKGTKMRFLDAQAKPIVEIGIDLPDKWTCKGNRLERRNERTSGLGEVLRTERVEETLSRDASGELVYTETVAPIGKSPAAPRRSEARFRPARVPA